ARTADHDTGCLGASDLMERVLSRPNLQAALKRVRQNKGGPGIDGLTVEELPGYLRDEWPVLREQLLAVHYQPQAVQRRAIPKSGRGMRGVGSTTGLKRYIQQDVVQHKPTQIDP